MDADFEKIVACGGSWMCPKDLITAGEFDKIKELTREAVNKMLGYQIRHVGINAKDETEAHTSADLFNAMFGFEKKDGNSSVFAGTGIEIMKTPYLGANGHIAIQTNYVERAMYRSEERRVGKEC